MALGIIQIMSLVLPLITLPYLTRVLGVNAFGQVAFAQIIFQYFIMITDWGFSWSATKEVALVKHDREKLSALFLKTWLAQLFLLLILFCVLLLAILYVPFFEKYKNIYLVGFSLVIGNVLLPLWLVQGLESSDKILKAQFFTKLLVLPLTFICVDNNQDAIWAIGVLGFTSILSGLATQYWIWSHLGLTSQKVSLIEIVTTLKDSANLFFSRVAISLYTTLIPVVLGIVSGHTNVAIYSLADKFRVAAQSVLAPISQALFPRLSYLYKYDPDEAKKLLKKSGLIMLILSFLMSVILFFSAELIIYIFGGENFYGAVLILKILSPIPFIICVSNLLGVQIMLPNNKIKAFNNILFVAGILSFILMYPLIKKWAEMGAAINILLIELFVASAMMMYVVQKRLIFSKKEVE